MMKLFLKFEFEKIIKYFQTKKLAKIITISLFILVFMFVGSGIYSLFFWGFKYMNYQLTPDIRLALTLFLYETFLLILSGIIIFSSIVSGIFNLFKGKYDNWIISSPGYKIFPRMVITKSVLHSFIPSLVMFLPAVLAFNRVYHLGFLSLFFILLSIILLLILLNAITLSSIVLISHLYYVISKLIKKIKFTFNGLVTLIIILSTIFVVNMWKIVTSIDLVKLFKADVDSEILSISNISEHFHLLPTHQFAMEIINWQSGKMEDAINNFSILLIFAVISVFIWLIISRLYYPLWQKFQEGSMKTDTTRDIFVNNKHLYHFNGGKTFALFKKEAMISIRNRKGVLWFLFLCLVWIAEIGANVILGNNIARHEADINQKIIILQTIQFIIAVYFISAFTLRFVFPSFSMEKKTAWIIGSAPLSFKKIFFGKYLFYTLFFVILGTLMSYLNSYVLGLEFTNAFYSILLLIATIIFIITLGLSLGAIFPSYETDDPESISTSMSGLFFTALALIYGALSASMLYITLTTEKNLFWLLAFIIFTCVLTIIILIKTPKIVKNRAFNM